MLIQTFVAQAAAGATPAVRGLSATEVEHVLLSTAAFTLFGLLVFALAFAIIVKATPFSIRKEIEEDQNVALAVVIGAVIIGISLIIAAAIQG
ncbi:MAG TPA: DUF350 domain-containing protein [Pyrinomonadaceae bacterium]|nr:DUF350 domain-containing protein [Pyrinomonadaceae bacterium]